MANSSRAGAGLALAVTSLLTFLSGLVAAACLAVGVIALNPLLLAVAALAATATVIFFRLSRGLSAPHDLPRV